MYEINIVSKYRVQGTTIPWTLCGAKRAGMGVYSKCLKHLHNKAAANLFILHIYKNYIYGGANQGMRVYSQNRISILPANKRLRKYVLIWPFFIRPAHKAVETRIKIHLTRCRTRENLFAENT